MDGAGAGRSHLTKQPRALLVYAAEDEAIAEHVAALLGRHRTVRAARPLDSGPADEGSRRPSPRNTDLVVLFATRQALEDGPLLDAAAAGQLLPSRGNNNVLVLDFGGLGGDSAPNLLKGFRFERVRNAHEATLRINRALYRLSGQLATNRFIGRTVEYSALEARFIESRSAAHVFFISGPFGMGRESLATETAHRVLKVQDTLTVDVREGADIRDLLAAVAASAAVYQRSDELVALVRQLFVADEISNENSLHAYLRTLAGKNQMLVLRDEGGVLEPGGGLSDAVRAIVDAANATGGAYVAVIARRRPPRSVIGKFPALHLSEMAEADMRKLLSSLFRTSDRQIDADLPGDILGLLRGYPPAAYNALLLVEQYGEEFVRTKKLATDFHSAEVLREFRRRGALDGVRTDILSLLLAYSPLPFAVLEEILRRRTAGEFSDAVSSLQADGFVTVDRDGYYSVSRMFVEVVSREVGIRRVNHANVATRLRAYVEAGGGYEPSLALFRCLYRAITFSNTRRSPLMIELNSDVEILLEREYHRRNYRTCIELSERVTTEGRSISFNATAMVIKAYAHVGDLDRALQLAETLPSNRRADAAYLRAFTLRKKGEVQASMDQLRKAIAWGKKDAAVYWDLAWLHFRLGAYADAQKAIRIAEERRDEPNRYIVDLKVQIALAHSALSDVDQLMVELARIDDVQHYYYRESEVAYVKGNYRLALEKARRSIDGPHAPKYFTVQLVKTLIELGEFVDAATTIDEMFKKCPGHHDAEIGLRVKLLTKQGKFMQALELWQSLRDQTVMINRALKRNALAGMLAAMDARSARAREIEAEIIATAITPNEARLA